MRLTFHVLLNKEMLPTMGGWQSACTEMGFHVAFSPATLAIQLVYNELPFELEYKGRKSGGKISLEPTADVQDICDELRSHIREDQEHAVRLVFNDDQENLPGVSIAVSVLTKICTGTIYVEGDGAFFTPDEAMENARNWEKA